MTAETIVMILAAIALWFGITKKHNQGWIAFVALILGITLMGSALAGPAHTLVQAIIDLFTNVLAALGANV